MSLRSTGDIPQEILEDSVLARLFAAYSSVAKKMERRTGCSATRGLILFALRGGADLNQNQIATLIGLDRTVVHRAIKAMVEEGLLSERKAPTGRAIHVRLTAKGQAYRKRIIAARVAADGKLRETLTAAEQNTLVRLLDGIAAIEL